LEVGVDGETDFIIGGVREEMVIAFHTSSQRADIGKKRLLNGR
jgi:hypothetical protein